MGGKLRSSSELPSVPVFQLQGVRREGASVISGSDDVRVKRTDDVSVGGTNGVSIEGTTSQGQWLTIATLKGLSAI